MSNSACLFCRIAAGEDANTSLIYRDDDITVFRDIKPASTHHYLILPKKHKSDAKHLGADDVELVERLRAVGTSVLERRGGSVADSRMGFHWPPCTSISHLHLHVISPEQEMGWIARAMFKMNSWWFVSVDWLVDRLKKMRTLKT